MKYFRVLEADRELLEAQEKAIRAFGIQTLSSVFGYSIAYDYAGEISGIISKKNGKDNNKVIATNYAEILTQDGYCYMLHPSDPILKYSQEYIKYIEDNLTNKDLEVVEVDLSMDIEV